VRPAGGERYWSLTTAASVAIFYCTVICLPVAFLVSLISRDRFVVTAVLIASLALVAARAVGVSLTLSDEGLVVRNGLLRHEVPWSEITGFETAWELFEPRGLLTLSNTAYVRRRGKKRLMIEAFIWTNEESEIKRAVKSAAQKRGVALGGDFAWT
jgi:Bacterial PH domain